MSNDITYVQLKLKQKCLSINSVKSLFQVHKTSKKIFVIFEKFINKGLECKYMITTSRPLLNPICSGHIILLFSKYFSNLLNKILVNNLLMQLEIAIPQ